MSDSGGGGESGGAAAGAGQDAEADNEPPQRAPPLPEGDGAEVRRMSEEGAPPSAKRLKMGDETKDSEKADTFPKVHEETTAQTGYLQEDDAPPGQSTVSKAACVRSNAPIRLGSYEC